MKTLPIYYNNICDFSKHTMNAPEPKSTIRVAINHSSICYLEEVAKYQGIT